MAPERRMTNLKAVKTTNLDYIILLLMAPERRVTNWAWRQEDARQTEEPKGCK